MAEMSWKQKEGGVCVCVCVCVAEATFVTSARMPSSEEADANFRP